mmetsp:Transcript_87180/g.236284  ORF Transcript_87180/g.236284 Transcript_87180/m.236284 type:complete len:206 (+) Transcript_87180:489-1106(+)
MAGPGKPRARTNDRDLMERPSASRTSKAPSQPSMNAARSRTKVWGSRELNSAQKSEKRDEDGRPNNPDPTSCSPRMAFHWSAPAGCISAERPCALANAMRLQASKTSGCAMAGERSHWMPSSSKRRFHAPSHGSGSTTHTDGCFGPLQVAARSACSVVRWSCEYGSRIADSADKPPGPAPIMQTSNASEASATIVSQRLRRADLH